MPPNLILRSCTQVPQEAGTIGHAAKTNIHFLATELNCQFTKAFWKESYQYKISF